MTQMDFHRQRRAIGPGYKVESLDGKQVRVYEDSGRNTLRREGGVKVSVFPLAGGQITGFAIAATIEAARAELGLSAG